jgi:putative serine protease PepD
VSTPTPPYQSFYTPPAEPAPTPAAVPKRRTGALVAGGAAIALVAGAVGGGVGYLAADRADQGVTSVVASSGVTNVSAPAAGSVAAIAASVAPAVVQLDVENGAGQGGTGSGFVISDDGYIITNNHVAGGAGKDGRIKVSFSDGTTATGTLVGTDAGYDIAIVKINRDNLTTVPLGSSSALQVGDNVIAVGSPLGLQGTVTTGIVSALNRPVTAGVRSGDTSFINAIQTDAAINPGNSGGPLVNGVGEVIGVNTAIASMGMMQGAQAGSIGLGFAIPIDTVKRLADEIIKTGTAKTPVIGVKLDPRFEGPGGRVAGITEGGPAEAAGLQVDDVVTKVDGRIITDSTALIVAIRAKAPGDQISLTVLRDGGTIDVPLTLQGQELQR